MLDKEKLGKTIAFYRKEQNMTQRELADLLHISYQAVSKWEAGISMPTVEILCELAGLFHVSVDEILNSKKWENRGISFMDVGLNTKKLYTLKDEILKLNSEDEQIVSARYADAVVFEPNVSDMTNPVYSMVTCVPGSKEKFANLHGYDEEICVDVAASGINHLLQHGMQPIVLKAMLLCNGNKEGLYLRMAQTFKRVCEENDVLFTGMEIAAQPTNYKPDEYHVSATLVGVADKKDLLTGEQIQEGDVVIGLCTEGIDGANYPVIKVMLDRKPELLYAKLDENHSFADELMKGNSAFTKGIIALQREGLLHGASRMRNYWLNPGIYERMPEDLGVCLDLSKIQMPELYRFLYEQDMIGANNFSNHFHCGIGMFVIVDAKEERHALEILREHHDCYVIGKIKKRRPGNGGLHAWTEGKIVW